MKKINVLIVDDEPRAHKILENYIERTPALSLVGNAFNAIEASSFLQSHETDLIFLDITMPEINGFEFLKLLKKPHFVIFTTAHSEFALESYEFNAVDYLKKPIPYDRFFKSITKLVTWIEKGITFEPEKDHIDLRIDGNIKAISLDKIQFIQSLGNYVKVYSDNKALVTQVTTNEIEDSLPKSHFLRIHKSFIVNKSKIESATDEEITIDTHKLPIGKTFKKYVKEYLGRR